MKHNYFTCVEIKGEILKISKYNKCVVFMQKMISEYTDFKLSISYYLYLEKIVNIIMNKTILK